MMCFLVCNILDNAREVRCRTAEHGWGLLISHRLRRFPWHTYSPQVATLFEAHPLATALTKLRGSPTLLHGLNHNIKVGIYWRPVGIFTFAKHGRIKLLRSSAGNHQATWFYLSLRNGYISHEHICDPSHAMSSDSIVPGQNEEVEYQYLYICTT